MPPLENALDLVVPSPPAEEEMVRELTGRLVERRLLGEYGDRDRARAAAVEQVERIRANLRVLHVVEAGRLQGRVWLVREVEDLAVVALALEPTASASAVRHRLEDRARAEGARRLTVAVAPGDRAALSLVQDGAYEVTSLQLRLDLVGEVPGRATGALLEPMDDATWSRWEAGEVEAYAAERVLAGESPEQAREISRRQHDELLPEGRHSAEHHFFTARVDQAEVGTVWLSTSRPMAFVYDLVVHEHLRGKGHGARVMQAAAGWAAERGAHAIGLHVFGYNHVARRLYERLGYRVVETTEASRLA